MNTIPDNLKHYWWRGYFDGDGSIRKDGKRLEISSGIKQDWSFISKLPNIKFSIQRNAYLNKKSGKINSCSKILAFGENAKLFTDYIYNGEIFGLERKRKYAI